MIWALAREQVRSQRRYLLSTALVIAVTVAVASYGALMALTLIHSQNEIDHFMGHDRDSAADASTYAGYVFGDLASDIDTANAEGHEVVGVASLQPMLAPTGAPHYNDIVALYGDVDWAPILVEGAAPNRGEIVVSAQWATESGVQVGDTIGLVVDGWAPAEDVTVVDSSLRVSGLSRSPVGTAGVDLYLPAGFVSWHDVPVLNTAWSDAVNAANGLTAEPGEGGVAVTVSGNGNWPWSADLAASANPAGYSSSPGAAIAIIAAIGAGALVIGLIAMAFALGRAQAQARTKWLGTVRALGATKRHVASASLLESAAVGVTAGIVGYILGALGAVAHCGLVANRVAAPMIVASPGGYIALAVGAVALAIVLALIVGAVPAFWSTRITPTAALKPVTDLSEATVSRNVKVWPLTATWLIALAIVALGAGGGMFGPIVTLVVVAAVVVAVTTVMLAHEVLRRSLPWHARRMSASGNRAVMVAGDAIAARPRQATIPAFIVALATTVTLALLTQTAAAWAVQLAQTAPEYREDPLGSNPYIAPLPLLGVYAVVTLLCVAVALATAGVSSREAATREALGLTSAQGRLAAALQYLVAQGHGLALGLIGGAAGGVVLIATNVAAWREYTEAWIGPAGQLFALACAVAGACAVVGATVTAAFVPRTAPLARVEVSA